MKNDYIIYIFNRNKQEFGEQVLTYLGFSEINPGSKLYTHRQLEALKGLDRRKFIWCGDFNAHSTLWGGDRTDRNGLVVKDMMDSLGLVCLNDGNFMRIDCSASSKSSLDFTMFGDYVLVSVIEFVIKGHIKRMWQNERNIESKGRYVFY